MVFIKKGYSRFKMSIFYTDSEYVLLYFIFYIMKSNGRTKFFPEVKLATKRSCQDLLETFEIQFDRKL